MDIDEEKARAGHTGDGVRYMLIGSLVLVVAAFGVMLAVFVL